MSVLLLGLSHKTAPVEVRERFAIAEQDAGQIVGELARQPGIAEAMVLSTCNRVEFLVRSETSPDPTSDVLRFLSEARQLPLDHPFAAVTNDKGEFEIPGLPAGTHRFKVWHEGAGFLQSSLAVTVKADGTVEQEIKYPVDKFKP